MKIEIIRERRKTMVLKIEDNEHAVLKVPRLLSEKRIENFLNDKRNWIEKTARKMDENKRFADSFQFDKFVYLNGEKAYSLGEIAFEFEDLSAKEKRAAVKKFYLSNFESLVKLAEKISSQTGLKYKQIKPLSSVRIWGSFNSDGVMKLNWKLAIVPQKLAEYVICHELSHGLHMNHSPKFWAQVQKICPDFKVLKNELSRYSFILKKDFFDQD